jgi:metal-responsive CopG/Arc/MetJ family transcriptional regulator
MQSSQSYRQYGILLMEVAMASSRVEKITISLPKELLEVADKLAREEETTRSAVIANLLRRAEESRIESLMAEGYREMAEENRRLAAQAFPVVSETILRTTRWEKKRRAH